MERDPAATSYAEIIFTYSGLHALVCFKISSALKRLSIPFLPRILSQLGKWITGIEIHPCARIGKGLFIDHGMGVVIGETSIIGNNVTLFQGVTLGGTGKEKGKRHPTLGNNVVVGAGAKILGPVKIGDGAMIGAGSVVVKDIPENDIAVGVPAKVISKRYVAGHEISLRHDQISDPLMGVIKRLEERVFYLEKLVEGHGKGGSKKATG